MKTRTISIMAISIAIIAVLIRSVQVPIPGTGGYSHPGAVAEIFISIAFGPIVGFVGAGVGGAIADLTSGYGSFAPMTFIAHGAMGYIAGFLSKNKSTFGMISGWVFGGISLVLAYYLIGAFFYGQGLEIAAIEIPFNLIQVSLGFFGIVLYKLVKEAYPNIVLFSSSTTFTEEK